MIKLISLIGICLLLFAATSHAQSIKFLEEKTAFCYSEESLAKYLEYASEQNFDSLNNLFLKGKCDFVPDGEIVRLKNYRIDSIGQMKIVEFEMNNQNLWTFNALVETADFSGM